MNNDLISVIIPAYNAKKRIDKTIQSIISEYKYNLELIIINDGSTDNTREIIERYARHDTRITVKNITNHGVSYARNLGVDLANGEWVYFIDSDDTVNSSLFELTYTYKTVDMIVFGAWYENLVSNTSDIVGPVDALLLSQEEIQKYLFQMDKKHKPVIFNYVWNRLFRKSIIKRYCLKFDENLTLGEDFVFICNYFKHINSVAFVSTPFYHYYIWNSTSLARKFYPDEASRRVIMQNSFLDVLSYYSLDKSLEHVFKQIEGEYCFSGIGRVVDDNCTLIPLKDKLRYIASFFNDNNIDYMCCYLNEKGGKHKIISYFFRTKKALIIYVLLIINRFVNEFKQR